MLRITQPQGPTPLLVVEGDLIGHYVNELRTACAQAAPSGGPLLLDLEGVSFLDARGIALLEELARSGVRLVGGSAFVREVLRRLPSVAESSAPWSESRDLCAWLAALRRGEESAREELVRRFGPGMLASARRLLGSQAEAEDALREAFWLAFDSAGCLPDAVALEAWLQRLVVEVALGRLDSPRGSTEPARELLPCFTDEDARRRDEADEVLALEGPGAHLEALAPEVQALVRSCVDGLPEPERTALLLCDVEGFGIEEAAGLLGSEPGTTRRRLHHARQALRSLLGRALADRQQAGRPASPLSA